MDDDVLQASAARFLIDGGEEDAASVLLSCTLRIYHSGDTWFVGDETHFTHLQGPSRITSETGYSEHTGCGSLSISMRTDVTRSQTKSCRSF
jgi:hypothetical protein